MSQKQSMSFVVPQNIFLFFVNWASCLSGMVIISNGDRRRQMREYTYDLKDEKTWINRDARYNSKVIFGCFQAWHEWKWTFWMRTIFSVAHCVALYIQTDTDWLIVVGLSMTRETLLAYGYLVNDGKCDARMSVCMYEKYDEAFHIHQMFLSAKPSRWTWRVSKPQSQILKWKIFFFFF